jgi:aminoglycoside phosphotransferase (APT) family kinase protein
MRPEIRRPDEIDAAWLTTALQSAGFDAVVGAVEAEPVGTGQIGDSVRFRLRYERGADIAPTSVVGKFPSADPSSLQAARSGGHYVREVQFYRRLAARAQISTPRAYVAEVDEATSQFVLLLEDLAPARQGDQLRGVTLEQASLAIDEAAKLHASHWADETLHEEAWLVGSRRATRAPLSAEVMQAAWRGFCDRYADRLEVRVIEASRRLVECIERFRTLQFSPSCLVHYDFRPDNMMFATPDGGRLITVLDWQSVGFGAGPADLGYFLAGALPAHVRRANEAAFLERYHQRLLSFGVTEYDADAMRRDYALGGLRLLLIAFLSSKRVKQTPRGDDMFMQMASAAAEHAFDNGAFELLA